MTVTVLLEWLAAIALGFLCAIGALFTRRVVIRRRGGTFDCSLRLTPGSAQAAVHYGTGTGADQAQETHVHHGGRAQQAQEQHQHQPQARTQARAHPGEPTDRDFPTAARGTRTPFSASGVRAGRGWSYGIAQYENDRIDWYRIFSYAYRPAAVLTRRDLEVIGRRDADGHDELALFPGWTIVECRFGTGLVELAMSPDALTGFLSWLEAAPPGQNVGRVS
jgi:Protein of unknown function (DUF2550)